ncbi:TetR/AcrR family transcriptional regulator [Ktedonosporobacter rubrisoli]|uniref:TetR/AcrR family transcriptional regulator n=1 Tax=Ktedonosporobacter rubrisoli TaxID=2509675 RepID=A0A4V0YY97_KTERU|nr:TetR/AcrR family transcriptional regulator [Ktedonosporobacter rubrisoli]QBD75461.1 TetR/AcrR family transcriptional regulator [Ktedonosporobacter rubrisoli]
MSKQAIQNAALLLFARQGYEGTSIADIAQQVGIHKSTVYAHFVNKEALFLAVVDEVLQSYTESLEQMVPPSFRDRPVQEQLYAILRESSSIYRADAPRVALYRRAVLFPPPALREQILERFAPFDRKITTLFTSILEQGLANGELRQAPLLDLVAAYNCLFDGLFMEFFYYPQEQFEEQLERAWRCFWAGVAREQ